MKIIRWKTLPITLDELLCKKNEKDLIDLLKTLNVYKTDMGNKKMCTLRKVAEKFYEEFIDDEELSDDLKKAGETAGYMQRTETIY